MSNVIPQETYTRVQQLIQDEVDRCHAVINALGGHVYPVAMDYNLKGRTAGMFVWHRRDPSKARYRWNMQLAIENTPDYIARTVPHECAHAAAWFIHGTNCGHGPKWRALAAQLGITNVTRCHTYATTPARVIHTHTYHCACGPVQLTSIRHNKIIRGQRTYICRKCRTTLQQGESE